MLAQQLGRSGSTGKPSRSSLRAIDGYAIAAAVRRIFAYAASIRASFVDLGIGDHRQRRFTIDPAFDEFGAQPRIADRLARALDVERRVQTVVDVAVGLARGDRTRDLLVLVAAGLRACFQSWASVRRRCASSASAATRAVRVR